MSPLNYGECQNLDTRGDFYFCSTYKDRPEECVNHSFVATYCPVGMGKLGLTSVEDARIRIEHGFALLKFGGDDVKKAINSLYEKTSFPKWLLAEVV